MKRHRWPREKISRRDFEVPEKCANGCGIWRRYRDIPSRYGSRYGSMVFIEQYSTDGGATWERVDRVPPCATEEPR